jgi:DNA-binding CsgD family transcriptional regulator
VNTPLRTVPARKYSTPYPAMGVVIPPPAPAAEGQSPFSATTANGDAGLGGVLGVVRQRLPLTEREKQILRLVCDGLTNAEIGRSLRIAAETVKSELKRIFRKIEVKNRTQAAVLLVRSGLL